MTESATSTPTTTRRSYAPRELLALNRGGGLFSEAVNQRIAAVIGAPCASRGLHPTVLTMGSLLLGVGTAVVVILTARSGAWWPGVVAVLGWQLAYSLDCADGQVARATGKTGEHGARVDVLADFAVQTVLCSAVASVAYAHSNVPVSALVAFGMLWVLNLFTSVLAKSDPDRAHSLVRSTSLPVRAVKLIRDPGLLLLVIGLIVLLVPAGMVWFVWAMIVLNGLFLLASIGNEARRSMAPRRS